MKKVINLKTILFFIVLTFYLHAQGSLMLVGGGRENTNSWSDLPYGWFVAMADSGKIINIDVSEASDWYPGYFKSLGAADGEAMQISNKTMANDSATYNQLITAKGIFIEGGDQWQYVSTWKGTLVEDAIHHIFNNGGAIGGSSAGLAVLGEVCFDAKFNSAYPNQTAYDAYDSKIHLEDDFLKILPNVLTDSHFHSRGRIGRLVPMLAQRIQDFGENELNGIGVADKTALCIDKDNQAIAYGHGSVTILYKTAASIVKAEANKAVLFTDIGFDQLIHGAKYDLNTHQLIDAGPYMNEYNVTPSDYTYVDTTWNGGDASSASLGDVEITRLTGTALNAWNGNLSSKAGTGKIPGTIIIPAIWNESDFYENRIIGGMWGAVLNPGKTVVYSDDNNSISVTSEGVISSDKILYILDTKNVTHAGVNGFNRTNYNGLIGARINFLDSSVPYDLKNSSPVTALEKKTLIEKPDHFNLLENYPNPFNAGTLIRYYLAQPGKISLMLYNARGQLVDRILASEKHTGWHRFSYYKPDLSSGVYYLVLQQEGQVLTRKVILLK